MPTEIERLRQENDYLRGLIPALTSKCVHCGLENMAKCAYGFPGCAWADDIMCAEEEIMKRLLEENRAFKAQQVDIRKACLKIDTLARKPDKWSGSLEWATSQVMCIVKFGEGYSDHNAPNESEQK